MYELFSVEDSILGHTTATKDPLYVLSLKCIEKCPDSNGQSPEYRIHTLAARTPTHPDTDS